MEPTWAPLNAKSKLLENMCQPSLLSLRIRSNFTHVRAGATGVLDIVFSYTQSSGFIYDNYKDFEGNFIKNILSRKNLNSSFLNGVDRI